MNRWIRSTVFAAGWALLAAGVLPGAVDAPPQGQVTYAMHVTVAPAWFDPADNTGIATPFIRLKGN